MQTCRAAWVLIAVLCLTGAEALIDTSARVHSTGHSLLHPRGHGKEEAPGHSHAPETLLVQQEQGPETSHTSWFERLGNAIFSVLIGLFVMIPFSISLLWTNERRNAQLESLISLGQSEVETVTAEQKDLGDYDGMLVHLNSEDAKGLDPVQDKRFPDVKMESGCLRLTSTVEVYQWLEEVHEKKKKDSVGGGETTVKTYSYKKAWSLSTIDSSRFHNKTQHENSVHVKGLAAGICEEVNGTVMYGEPYRLPREMVQQLNKFEDAGKLVGDELKFDSRGWLLLKSDYSFKREGGYYQCPVRTGGEPQIGDFRVTIKYVLDGPASLLALQVKDKSREGGHTFGPYRSVPRGFCCGVADSQLKKRLITQAKKDDDELYEEQRCWDFGPFRCLCCCCNIVTYCFTHCHTAGFSLTPQIYSAWSGERSARDCFNSEKSSGMAAKWGMRLLGWALLWIGFSMLFEPLEVVLDIIPFLGPYLGTGLAWVVGFFTLLLTVALATFIVSLAYLIYHPLIGLLYLALTAGIVVGITFIAHAFEAHQ